MKLLALETATMFGGVAIMEDYTLIAESRANVKVTHSERVMTEIDHVLRHSGMTIRDIDVFGISIGPGSFTGLRVGLSTVKGLAFASAAGLVAVPTLESLAWNVPFTGYQVCPMLDARKKQVYAALFKWSEDGFVRVMDECAIAVRDLMPLIKERTVFLGEGMLLNKETIERGLGELALFSQPHKAAPSPANTAYLCMLKAMRGQFEDAPELSPLYIRRSEAESKGSE
jgi:tRNA threonylcarbamoyladenosine biosynthesis protein TsaB